MLLRGLRVPQVTVTIGEGLTLDNAKREGDTVARPCRIPTGFFPDLGAPGLERKRVDRQSSPEALLATRLILLCHAAIRSMRGGGFPAQGEPLDAGGLRKSAAFAVADRPDGVALSPAIAARQTVAALGLFGEEEAALRDVDHGDWTGLSFAEVHARDAAALARWLAAPGEGAPGGESMRGVVQRVGGWMDGVAGGEGVVMAVTHPTVIRAAIAHALGMTAQAVTHIDIAPLTAVALSYNRRWRLQAIVPA